MLKPSERLPALTSVWLPDVMRLNDNVTPAGQTAGFLGKLWEPERFVGDPAAPDYRIEGLDLAGELTAARVDRRRDLLGQLDRSFDTMRRAEPVEAWDRLSQHAVDLVTSGRAARPSTSAASPTTRDRYGAHLGAIVLLARRLVEAGVRLVHVNWAREPGDSAVDNPMWDTHAQNADRLQDSSARSSTSRSPRLLTDLADRGLLDETLVVVIGEFGRTPRINKLGGRDHWGHVFSFALAGAGIRGGQVIGASDKNGAYPATGPDPRRRPDGDDLPPARHRPERHVPRQGEPAAPDHEGRADRRGAGHRSRHDRALRARRRPGVVPPYDASLLLDTAFDADLPLVPPAPPRARRAGGRSHLERGSRRGLAVRKDAGGVVIGYGLGDGKPGTDARCVLAQEIRNARGGHYTFTVRASGEAASADEFEKVFLAHFTCRLVLFRFRDTNKDPRNVDELAAGEFRPAFGKWRASRSIASSARRCPGRTSRSATAWASRSSSRRRRPGTRPGRDSDRVGVTGVRRRPAERQRPVVTAALSATGRWPVPPRRRPF